MARHRTLADELAELINPAPAAGAPAARRGASRRSAPAGGRRCRCRRSPHARRPPAAELDPEAAAIGDGDAPAGSDDELAGLVAGAAAARRGLRTDIALRGGAYAGRRSSRAALFGNEFGPAGAAGDDGDVAGFLRSGSGDDGHGSGSGSEGAEAGAPPRRDVPTLFVNGHRHGPGADDTTSSSSGSEDEGDVAGAARRGASGEELGSSGEEQEEASEGDDSDDQQQQRRRQGQGQGRERGAQRSGGGSSSGGEDEADGEGGSNGSGSDGSGSDDDRDGDEARGGGAGARRQQQQRAVDPDAAAAGVAAMLGGDAEMEQLEREAAAAQAEAQQQLVAAAGRGDRDAAKAAGVRAQQRLWGAALELRIRLQKAVAGANVLPRPAARAALVAGDEQVAASYAGLVSSCQATLEQLLHLHHRLAQQHPAAAAALAAAPQQPAAGAKRRRGAAALDDDAGGGEPGEGGGAGAFAGACGDADAAWAAVEGAIDGLAGFRDAALDKWHRRTVLSSGTAALRGSSGLRALQQSVSAQVGALMRDQRKLVARSQLPAQVAPRPLGQPARGAGADGAGADGERDPETYDEGDFYQQLLKELLESAPGGAPGALAGARPAKRRKLVDRRASKGRKLRFEVMDKLVGFMAPVELAPPPFAEQLFGNLFAHKG
ncbi:bfr2 [Scenedesmus sp. PABB004]|nr:bfr2 [Scenedesmus sp. PABB004]